MENGDEQAEPVRIVLGICTLQYEKKTVDCLMQMMFDRIFSGWAIPEAGLMPTVRNRIVQGAYEGCPDFTHIMFIDDDMDCINSAMVLALLQEDKDIIQGLCCARNPPFQLIHFTDETNKVVLERIKRREVIESTNTGMAFTLVKRQVFDDMAEDTPTGKVWFTMDRGQRDGWEAEIEDFIEEAQKDWEDDSKNKGIIVREAISFGQNAHIGARPTGEDVDFCRRAKQLGYQCFTHLGVHVGHIGRTTFDWPYAFASEYGEAPVEDEKPRIITGE